MESWPGSELWNNRSMEIEYLGHAERLRGEWFYEKEYDAAISSGDTDMMEILYVCMCLGFEGKHRGNSAKLKNHMDNLYARIHVARPEEERDGKMYPKAYEVDLTSNDPRMPMRVATVATVFFGIVATYLVVHYFTYTYFIDELKDIAARISQ